MSSVGNEKCLFPSKNWQPYYVWLETVIKHTFYFVTIQQINVLVLENLSILEKKIIED